MFDAVVERAASWPSRPALSAPHGETSYQKLLADVTMAARGPRLTDLAGRPVVVRVNQPSGRPVALLLASALGAVAVPMEAGWPTSRVSELYSHFRPAATISDDGTFGPAGVRVVSRHPVACANVRLFITVHDHEGDSPTIGDDHSYLMFTSGSTGTPKGVLMTNTASRTHADGVIKWLGLDDTSRILQFSRLSFDTSQEETWPTLMAGGCVVTLDRTLPTFDQLIEGIREQHVTLAQLPTAYWRALTHSRTAARFEPDSAALATVVIGGEAAYWDDARRWYGSGFARVRLVNSYGPTECGITASAFSVDPDESRSADGSIPLGEALGQRTFTYVPTADNVFDLHVSGPELARGYVYGPDTPVRVFGDGPGVASFDTRDLVTFDRLGRTIFVGRADRQVKVRGARVELDLVESALIRFGAREAYAFAVSEAASQMLAAAISGTGDVAQMRRRLRSEYGEHMTPTRIHVLDRLPRLASGKVDRAEVLRVCRKYR
jgi:non-ribosomal peptide synthetase component F